MTAQYFALELVATKLAIIGALETLGDTSPMFDNTTNNALHEWAWESGRSFLDDDEAFREAAFARSAEIEERMLLAVGRFLTFRASRSAVLRGAA